MAIVGIATYGGAIPALVREQVADALAAGLDIVSGLHQQIADDPDLAALVARHGARVVELRAPLPFPEQRFWSGTVLDLTVPRIAVLGTDCDIGKRTTLVRLADELRRRGRPVEVVATGQTGLLQGARQGFVLDATPLDFISGGLEQALLEAASHEPDVILVQGQGSFRGPTGQVGPQLLAHTGVRHAILQHAPGRRFYKSTPEVPIAGPEGDLALIRLYGAEPLAMTLNGAGLADDERERAQADLAATNELPVLWPDHQGIAALADLVESEVLANTRPTPGG